MSEPTHPRWAMLGSDGLFTLLLSNLALALTLGLSLLPVLRRVYRTARTTPSRVTGPGLLVVLGVRLERGRIPPLFHRRLERALALRAEGDVAPRILVLGGRADGGPVSEAESGRRYLLAQGVEPAAVLTEERSRNTLENLHHARPLLSAQGDTPILISNRFHLARCAALAKGLRLAPRLCAAEEQLRLTPGLLLRMGLEAYYLHWYHVGHWWAHLTGNRKSLARIS